ncbi:MAG TPA: tetratricopeptide repeat protein [Bryobacteraceae bacterium]|nr:tetratricopeptide repeat protein [Bryobacteraceae bacterium]
MDTAHRRELKHDKFVEKVGHSVEYAAEHRSQVIKYGIAGLAAILIAAGAYWYINQQRDVRQAALRDAMAAFEAGIGEPNQFVRSFRNQDEKDKAVVKELGDVANKYSGKEEGNIARYFLGLHYADKGNLTEAEKNLKTVADSGSDAYASQAKLSLAQVYDSLGRQGDAEKLLRSLIDDPTVLVSKEQATITLARLLAKKNPAEARKLLEPLRAERGPVSRAAITLLGEIPAAR